MHARSLQTWLTTLLKEPAYLNSAEVNSRDGNEDEEKSGAGGAGAKVQRVLDEGYAVTNIDSTIIAQAPKMAPHIEAMRMNIAEDLGVPANRVSVKATTTEKLGFTGRGEGIACQAVCLLEAVSQ